MYFLKKYHIYLSTKDEAKLFQISDFVTFYH